MSYPLRRVFTTATLCLSLPFFVEADQTKGADSDEPEVRGAITAVVDLKTLSTMGQLLEKLMSKRVIFIGETHDRYEDHLGQLAIIEGLHNNKGRNLAVGMEFFQQPFQAYLDAYVAAEISEKELLRKTEYFDRWRFDYRLYQPILRFAREHGIPLLALNLPEEITRKVGDGGIVSLSDEERAQVPTEIDRDDEDYRKRIKAVFDHHPMAKEKNFEHFLEVQLLWDEGMAEQAARYLRQHPEKTLVVLAGTGHLEYGQGIPKRLLRRVPVPSAILLNGTEPELDPKVADYLLFPRPVALPESGLLGILLDADSEGKGVIVQGFADTSGAKDAGMKEGDRIVKIDGEPIDSYGDIRIALLGSRPGDKLPVEVFRERLVGKDRHLTFEVYLH
jgi:uncharacterized iron-regulated protein